MAENNRKQLIGYVLESKMQKTAVVKPGRILFEIEGLDEKDAERVFRLCSHKLPIKTKTVGRREVGV